MPRRLGMIAQISLYLLPASVILIFLPSCLFTYFEGWPYSVSVYYSFVTLSTIGFGDFIPTFQPHQVITTNKSILNQELNRPIFCFAGTRFRRIFQAVSGVHNYMVRVWPQLPPNVNFVYCKVKSHICTIQHTYVKLHVSSQGNAT